MSLGDIILASLRERCRKRGGTRHFSGECIVDRNVIRFECRAQRLIQRQSRVAVRDQRRNLRRLGIRQITLLLIRSERNCPA